MAAQYPGCNERGESFLNLVPDVVDELKPTTILIITYENNVSVDYGNKLTPTQVKNQPTVTFSADPEAWYLLSMTDPDPSNPKMKEIQHWLVGNIPGNAVTAGEVLSEYFGSGPPLGSGLHRYVFLLYKQPGRLTFDEPRLSNDSVERRKGFSTRNLARKYNLGNPIGFNVYQAQWDEYVPILHKQLGIS